MSHRKSKRTQYVINPITTKLEMTIKIKIHLLLWQGNLKNRAFPLGVGALITACLIDFFNN
jgi:hypothetical protein